MVNVKVAAAGQREPGLPGFSAQKVGVEQGQIGKLVERTDAFQHAALDEQAKPTQPFHLIPLAALLLAPFGGKLLHGRDIDQPFRTGAGILRAGAFFGADSVRYMLHQLRPRSVIGHGSHQADAHG
jgi:hypothetical protein